jgi:integrase
MPGSEFIAGGVRFQIYERRDRKRPTQRISYYIGSRRMRVTVRGDREAAEKKAKLLARQITSGEAAADALSLTPLEARIYLAAKAIVACLERPVDSVCREFVLAQEIIGPAATIEQAARFWKHQNAGDLEAAPVERVVRELLEHLTGARRESVTISSLKSMLKRFSANFPGTPIAHITKGDISRWLNGFPRFSPRTLNNHRAAVLNLFHFAKGKYLPEDHATAADHVARISDDFRGEIQIFKPWELTKILGASPETLRPAIALGAFAGLRTIELCRMDWSAIHWADESPATDGPAADRAGEFPHGYIEIKKAVGKRHRTVSRRLIPIQPNLASWLSTCRFLQGPVFAGDCNTFARAVSRIIRRLNKKQRSLNGHPLGRPANGLRHSYGSYRLPILKSSGALRLEMGNSEKQIFENYRELVAPADVEAYWKISRPDGQIMFPAAIMGG